MTNLPTRPKIDQAPPLASESRVLYEDSSYVVRSMISLDETARLIQAQPDAIHDPKVRELMRTYQQQIGPEYLDEVKSDPTVSWQEYFRLKTTLELYEQIVLLPLAYADRHGLAEEREKLSEDLYGINGLILEEAMQELKTPGNTHQDKRSLRGVINEQTLAMAVHRLYDTQDQAYLPSTTYQDLRQKTDGVFFKYIDGSLVTVPTQVKSSDRFSKDGLHNGILTISMSSLQGHNFRLSQAMLRELDGKNTPKDDEIIAYSTKYIARRFNQAAAELHSPQKPRLNGLARALGRRASS